MNNTADTTEMRPLPAPAAAPSRARSAADAEAPFALPIRCTSFTPAPPHRGGLLAYCAFEIAGGIRLNDVRLIATEAGIRAHFPRRAVLAGGHVDKTPNGNLRTVAPVEIPDPAALAAFSAAAVLAVEAAFPGALPTDRPKPATPPAPSLGRGNEDQAHAR